MRHDPRLAVLVEAIEGGSIVEVIAATLELRDRTANPVPVGGGIGPAGCRLRANDVVAALRKRGMLR